MMAVRASSDKPRGPRRSPNTKLPYPSIPLAVMIDWVADWIERGMPSHRKPTHYEQMKKLVWASALALCAGPMQAAAGDPVTFILNWVTAGEHAAVHWVEHAGWFDEAGIDFVIEQGQGSGVAAQRVGAGAADMALPISARRWSRRVPAPTSRR